MDTKKLQSLVKPNRVGWWAIQHNDGWWVGTDAGVTCYKTIQIARAALTIVWQREGGKECNFSIEKYTGDTVHAGEYTPIKSAEQALNDYAKTK